MLNILSGMQEGSRSVVTVSRSGAASLTVGAVVMTNATSNTIQYADNASNLYYGPCSEWIFEDLTAQSSGKYTIVYGKFEGETDQYTGTPAIGAFLQAGTSGTVGQLAALSYAVGTATNLVCAKVVDSYTLPVNPTMTSPVGGVATTVLRFRTV